MLKLEISSTCFSLCIEEWQAHPPQGNLQHLRCKLRLGSRVTYQLALLRSDTQSPARSAYEANEAPQPNSEPWVEGDAYWPIARSSEYRGGRLRCSAGRPASNSHSGPAKVVLTLLHRLLPGHPGSNLLRLRAASLYADPALYSYLTVSRLVLLHQQYGTSVPPYILDFI